MKRNTFYPLALRPLLCSAAPMPNLYTDIEERKNNPPRKPQLMSRTPALTERTDASLTNIAGVSTRRTAKWIRLVRSGRTQRMLETGGFVPDIWLLLLRSTWDKLKNAAFALTVATRYIELIMFWGYLLR